MKAFFIKSGETIVQTIVQTVRDYPKGTLIVAGVLIAIALVI